MKIPSNNIWTQTNEGDVFGVLHETRNINLTEPGKIKLARRSFMLYDEDDDPSGGADLSDVMAITYFNGRYYFITDDEMFSGNLTNGALTDIANEPTDLGLGSDALVIADHLYITSNDDISRLTTSLTWNLNMTSSDLATTTPHPIANFDSQTTYKVAVGDGNTVRLFQTDASATEGSTTLTLPTQFVVTTLAYRNGYLYVGTRNKNGNEAKIFIWDGATANANYEVPVGADTVYSITPYQSTVAFITSRGLLGIVNGTQMQKLATLPIFNNPHAIWQDDTNTLNVKVVHRGLIAVDDKLYLSIDGDVDRGFVPEMKSGIWIFDPRIQSLYHHTAPSEDHVTVETSFTVTNSTITTSAAHKLKTGDAIEFTVVDTLTGVDNGYPYYVSVESTTQIKLARSRLSLKNADYVTIGGSVGSDAFAHVPNTDWGHTYDNCESKALCLVSNESSPRAAWTAPIIYGAQFEDSLGNNKYGILTMHSSWNVGSFVTQRIYSQNIEQSWKKLIAFIDGCHLSNEEVIIKYRTKQTQSKPQRAMTGSWASATTFTQSTATDEKDPFDDIVAGNEIEVVNGTGRGYTAHVTGVSSGTVTIDESIGNSGDDFTYLLSNWTKLQAFTSTREKEELLQCVVDQPGGWIQFKVEMRGFETEIAHLELSNSVATRSV